MKTRITTALLAGVALLLIGACTPPTDERGAVQSAVIDMFVAVDERDWQSVRRSFADQVRLDYQSMTGLEPEDLSPDQIVKAWSGFLPGFDHTHHQLGNFQTEIEGDQARARFYGTATHSISDSGVWTVVGGYEAALSKSGDAWRIHALRLNFKYADGNLQLPAIAQQKIQTES